MKKTVKIKKSLVTSCLLISLILGEFSSCFVFDHDEPDTFFYGLEISIQDVSGNDLVSGIEVEDGSVINPDLYTLDIRASQLCEEDIASWYRRNGVIPDNQTPLLGMNSFNGRSFLTTAFSLDASECPNEKVITYKLKCPYVFGDEVEHEIIAYWDVPKIRNNSSTAICTRIEFDGDIFTPLTPQGGTDNKVIIILDDDENP